MKPEWLNRNLANPAPYFTLCTTEKMFYKELRALKIPLGQYPPFLSTKQSNATTHTLENSEGRLCAVVCIHPRTDLDPLVVAGILVHEAVHLWQTYCQDIGETSPSSEFEAYGIQHLAQQLMYEYKRQVYGRD